MPADQVPSDAEVEALLNDLLRALPSDISRRIAGTTRALLCERQAVPARIAAAAQAGFRAGWERSGEGWNAEYGVNAKRFAEMEAEELAKLCGDGTDHLAAQLAAAEARGVRKTVEYLKKQALGRPVGAGDGDTFVPRHLGPADFEKAILALIPTPPAGGADDADPS